MKTFTLKNKFQTNATLVANDFIDHYMVQANGEFIKVYLFLLRHLDNAGSSLTVSADVLIPASFPCGLSVTVLQEPQSTQYK